MKIPIFISVQSNVAYGFVGNRVATFVLQRLVNEVIAIHTAYYSHHPGHGFSVGSVELSSDVFKIVEGIKRLGLLSTCNGILTGFLGSSDVGLVVKNMIQEAQQSSSSIFYLCDPVVGDTGKGIYVNPELCLFFKEHLLPLATITTPNHFEAELLTDISIRTIKDAQQAASILHDNGPSIVVITSLACEEIGSSKIGTFLSFEGKCFLAITPLVLSSFTLGGCGDLFSALFLSHFYRSRNPIQALEAAVASTYSIIELTISVQAHELQIVRGQPYLIKPIFPIKVQGI